MAEKCIPQRKRLAMGEVPNKYAKGGMVMPRKKGDVDRCGCDKKCGGAVKKGGKR